MDFRKLRWYFMIPTTLFVSVFEYFRHYPGHQFLESLNPFWENVIAVGILTLVVSVFSHQLFVYIRDLTLDLIEEREKAETIIDNTSEAIIVLDNNRVILNINPKGKELTGHSKGDIINCLGGIPLIHLEQNQCKRPRCSSAECILNIAFEQGKTFTNRNVRFITTDCRKVYVRAQSCFIGKDRHLAIFLQDVTDSYQREMEARLLYEIGLGLLSIKEFKQNMGQVIGLIKEAFDADLALWFSTSDSVFDLQVGASAGVDGNIEGDTQGVNGDEGLEFVALSGKASFYDNARDVATCSSLAKYNLAAAIVAPVAYEGQNFGLLVIGWKQAKTFSDQDKFLCSTITNQFATALENVRLYQQLRSSATLEERRRLARELHDGLSQALGYLNIRLKYIMDLISEQSLAKAQAEMLECRALIQELFQETRNNIFNLKSGVPESGDFVEVAQKYLEEYDRLNSFNIIFQSQIETMVLPGEILVHLVRILQEALANVKKHSQADTVIVGIWRNDEDQYVLQIMDNGIGIDMEQKVSGGHYGLKIMEERVKLIGGEMFINTGKDCGVEFIITIPDRNMRGHNDGTNEDSLS